MKLSNVQELTASEFIYHLVRPKQYEATAHLMETNAWLENHGANKLKGLGDWSGVTSEAQARSIKKHELLVCIDAIINAPHSKAGRNSGKNMTPDQRLERARKAAAASARVRRASKHQ